MTRSVYQKELGGEDKSKYEWFKSDIIDVMRKHKIDPFMVVGLDQHLDENNKPDRFIPTCPIGGFFGQDPMDLLAVLSEGAVTLSKMFDKATPQDVWEAVSLLLDLRTKYSGGKTPSKEALAEHATELMKVLQRFGTIDTANAEKVEESEGL